MSKDTIYREDAIKALRCEYPTMPIFKGLREEWAIKTEGFRKAEEVIMSIPSADRPQGKWLDTGKDPSHSHPLTAIWYRCSECGDGTNTKTNYCPLCGARMKGADDE